MDIQMIIQIVLYVLILATAFPIGLLLASLTREELEPGRKWFFIILYSMVGFIVVLLVIKRHIPSILAIVYMAIVVWVSILKGKNKKFIRGIKK
jgi:hypothetical protein